MAKTLPELLLQEQADRLDAEREIRKEMWEANRLLDERVRRAQWRATLVLWCFVAHIVIVPIYQLLVWLWHQIVH
jgi:hypothetical protein